MKIVIKKMRNINIKAYILTIVLLVCCSVWGQKKEISTAKSIIKSGKNISQAADLMRKLLNDSTNHRNKKIYLTLFEAIEKQYNEGNEKLYLKQAYDTAALFMNTYEMFRVLEQLDSVEQIPDKKGRIKILYRKKHTDILDLYRPNLFNGGLYFTRKKDYDRAYRFFNHYIEQTHLPMYKSLKYYENDRHIPQAAYWAVYAGYKLSSPQLALRHVYEALKDSTHLELMLQYLSEIHRMDKDTTRYLNTLREGLEKYPHNIFFFSRLLDYYSDLKDWGEAMKIVDGALVHNQDKELYKIAQSTVLLNIGKYKSCKQIADSLISKNDSLTPAYLNAGLACYNQAVELDKNTTSSRKTRNQIMTLYKEALPYLEKYRSLAPDKQSDWKLPLYTIYLNLNMGKEFDELDKLIQQTSK